MTYIRAALAGIPVMAADTGVPYSPAVGEFIRAAAETAADPAVSTTLSQARRSVPVSSGHRFSTRPSASVPPMLAHQSSYAFLALSSPGMKPIWPAYSGSPVNGR